VLAYHLLAAVERTLVMGGDHRSWATIKDQLATPSDRRSPCAGKATSSTRCASRARPNRCTRKSTASWTYVTRWLAANAGGSRNGSRRNLSTGVCLCFKISYPQNPRSSTASHSLGWVGALSWNEPGLARHHPGEKSAGDGRG
jgi:hypothetical protein